MIPTEWIVGIVATLGVSGAIAAVIFFPAVAIPIVQSVVTWLMKCKPCLYALAVAGLMAASWWHGHHKAVLACREAELEAVIRNREFDLEKEKQSKADAEQRVKEIEESSNERAKTDAEYIEKLKAKPACLLDDDDIGVSNDKPRSRFKIPSFRTK